MEPDTFLDDLIQRTSNIIHIRILTPLPAEVHPELPKKHNVPFPTTKWSGENDLEKFETWIYDHGCQVVGGKVPHIMSSK